MNYVKVDRQPFRIFIAFLSFLITMKISRKLQQILFQMVAFKFRLKYYGAEIPHIFFLLYKQPSFHVLLLFSTNLVQSSKQIFSMIDGRTVIYVFDYLTCQL